VKERTASFIKKYHFGFNGKEDENHASTDAYDFGARIYDARLGRWTAVDPLAGKFVSTSCYSFAVNSPLLFIDYDGRDIIITPVKTQNNGPAKPSCVGEIAKTGGTKLFIFDEGKNSWNFRLSVVITLSSSYEKLCNLNGEGFDEFVKVHEQEHVDRFIQAANEDYTVSLGILDLSKSYSGKLDQIMTDFWNDMQVKISDLETKFNSQLNQLDEAYKNNVKNLSETSSEYSRITKEYTEARTSVRQKREQEMQLLNNNLSNAQSALYNEYDKRGEYLNQHYGSEDAVMNVSESKMGNKARRFSQEVKKVRGVEREILENCDDNEVLGAGK
jgi:RHS repeat-associated protein